MLIALLLCALTLAVADAGRPSPIYAAVALKPGDFIIGTTWRLNAMDRATGAVSVMSNDPHFAYPSLVASGPNGEIYVADQYYNVNDVVDDPTVARVDPSSGVPTVVATGGFGSFGGIATEPNGKLLVIDNSGDQIVRVNPVTGTRSMVSLGGKLIEPSGVAVESDGSILTTAKVSSNSSSGPRQIVRIRAGTGVQEVVSTGGLLVTPHSVAVGPDGTIFVADNGGSLTPSRILRIHPQSGAQANVSEFATGKASGILVEPAGMLYVTGNDSPCGYCIWRIDSSTGQRVHVNTSGDLALISSIAMVQVAAPLPCTSQERSQVSVTVTRLGNGRLRANIHANGSPNAIREIRLTTVPNAIVESPPTINGVDATFVLRRTGPGAITLPFTVVDACGEWKTFIGGGPNAF